MGQIFRYIFILTFLVIYSGLSFAEDTKTNEQGRKIFIESRCYTCHTIKAEAAQIEKEKEAFAKSRGVELKDEDSKEGDDEKKGGDLSNVGNERDSKWLTEFVTNPKKYFKDGADCKKIAKKKYRKRFKGSDEELRTLVNYIASLKYGKQRESSESCLKD